MEASKCPLCGKQHTVIRIFEIFRLLKCTLIADLIFLDGMQASKNIRLQIKKELGL